MSALLAAQSQSSNSASLTLADPSSLTPISLGASGTATLSYGATEQLIQRLAQMMPAISA
jgi:hypothetical protein